MKHRDRTIPSPKALKRAIRMDQHAKHAHKKHWSKRPDLWTDDQGKFKIPHTKGE